MLNSIDVAFIASESRPGTPAPPSRTRVSPSPIWGRFDASVSTVIDGRNLTRDRCYDFENIFAEKFSEKSAFFVQTANCYFCKICIMTMDFENNAKIFAENWQKSQKL
jgi:hypothetical protein